MSNGKSSTWRSASRLFASYGKQDLANEASFRADMAEQQEKTEAAIADSKFHYADHARRARRADANAPSQPEPIDEAINIGGRDLPIEVQRYAKELAISGVAGELYSKQFGNKNEVSYRVTGTISESDVSENLERCIAVLLETDSPVATASLLYRKIGDSWYLVDD